jgi:hypothetical protein
MRRDHDCPGGPARLSVLDRGAASLHERSIVVSRADGMVERIRSPGVPFGMLEVSIT